MYEETFLGEKGLERKSFSGVVVVPEPLDGFPSLLPFFLCHRSSDYIGCYFKNRPGASAATILRGRLCFPGCILDPQILLFRNILAMYPPRVFPRVA
jgi:hypothetical protein